MAWTWQRSPALNTTLNNAVSNCQHPGLLLDRFAPQESFGTTKRDWLAWIAQSERDPVLLQAQRERWDETTKRSLHGQMKPFALKTTSRLIVGLGAEHALETSITLDRNSGAPVIPGSALKGVARTFALIGIAQQLQFSDQQIETALNTLDNWLSGEKLKRATLNDYGFRDLNDEKRDTLLDAIKLFRLIFGRVGEIGRVLFFNGIHIGEGNPFEVDVMTPHFSSYYTASASRPAPSDDQNPVPVPYLVVKPEQTFWFAVGARTAEDVDLAKIAVDYLENGLMTYGVGAKTSQGYGVFRKPAQKG